jgi:hypothetical protein
MMPDSDAETSLIDVTKLWGEKQRIEAESALIVVIIN